MRSQTLVFLSLMTAIYAITSIIPFNVGEPLWIFFGVLFSYFAGSTCIAYIYVLNTINVTQNIFLIIAAGYSAQKALIAYNPNIAVYHLPWFFYPAMLIAGTYLGCFTGIRVCKGTIKRLHLLEKFSGIHA